jgi:hypothetical protein
VFLALLNYAIDLDRNFRNLIQFDYERDKELMQQTAAAIQARL